MKRKYLDELIAWKDSEYRKPLILWGARQVGKSFLVEELFAKVYFKNRYLKIDCSDDKEFVDFVFSKNNLKDVLDYIEIRYDFKADKNHLLFFDEVQECLPLVKMLKHFCEQRRDIPVIVSGSLVRIKIFRESHKRGLDSNSPKFLFPVGKINQLKMYPLTFDEFLLNYNENTYNFVKESYKKKTPLDNTIHLRLLDIVNDYFFVGGLPEVDDYFLSHKDDRVGVYKQVIPIIKEIYDNYLGDMELYQASPESIVRSKLIFKNIYKQLNKENKNFKFSLIEEGARWKDMANPVAWLVLAKIVNQSFQLKEIVTTPLIQEESSLMRLYLGDMGIFTYQSELNARSFLFDKNNSLSGIYYENFVANELIAAGFNIFYWKGKRNSEFEFIINIENRVIPIEVKKGRDRLNSLNEFRIHNKTDIAIKISSNNFGFDEVNKILTIPFYYVSFLLKDIKEDNFSY